MRIGLDIDNTLADIVDAARLVMSSDHGIPISEIVDTGVYWEPFTHKNPEIAELLKPSIEFWDRPSVLTLCKPIPNALSAAWRLHNAGLLACYITRRPPSVDHLTNQWLTSYGFPPVPVEHVGTPDSEDYFARCKSTVCQQYAVTHMIDDHASEADLLSKAGVEVILVDAPIGREARKEFLQANPHMRCAKDVSAAVDLLIGDLQAAA